MIWETESVTLWALSNCGAAVFLRGAPHQQAKLYWLFHLLFAPGTSQSPGRLQYNSLEEWKEETNVWRSRLKLPVSFYCTKVRKKVNTKFNQYTSRHVISMLAKSSPDAVAAARCPPNSWKHVPHATRVRLCAPHVSVWIVESAGRLDVDGTLRCLIGMTQLTHSQNCKTDKRQTFGTDMN